MFHSLWMSLRVTHLLFYRLQLDEQDPGGSDPEQLDHVKEILEKMNEAGVIASEGKKEGEDDWSEEGEEGEEEEEEIIEGNDVDME